MRRITDEMNQDMCSHILKGLKTAVVTGAIFSDGSRGGDVYQYQSRYPQERDAKGG